MRVGRAIVLALARSGFDVIVHVNRARQEAEDVAAEVRAAGRQAWVEQADFSVESEIRALAGRIAASHPALDVLVNSAAVYEQRSFDEIGPADLRRMLAVNVEAPFLLTQALLGPLRAAGGAVVNITDMAIHRPYSGSHVFAHYAASKAALEQLTRSLAVELGPDVRVNAVGPGPVAISADTTPEQREEILARVPAGREGSPDDVGATVAFLARAPYITGQTVLVDGGLSVA